MKFSAKIVTLIVVLAVIAGCKRVDDNPLTEELFKSTLDKQFTSAKNRLDSVKVQDLFNPQIDPKPVLFEQKEEGNAAEIYWEVLKDKVNSRSESRQQLLDLTAPIMQFVDLSMKERLEISPEKAVAIKADLEKASKIAELERLEQAARRSQFRLTGEVVPVPNNIAAMRSVPLTLLRAYAMGLMAKALIKEEAGQKAAAEGLLQTIVAMGAHFNSDANYAHYFNGQAIMEFGCYLLRSFYTRNKDDKKLEAVEALAKSINEQVQKVGMLGFRDELGQSVSSIKAVAYFDAGIDSLTNIAMNEQIPVAIRAGAIENLFYGYVFRYMVVQKSGRNPETSNYDPPSDQRIAAFEKFKSLPDKTLSQMGANGLNALAKMKQTNSSGERAKYWLELAKTPEE